MERFAATDENQVMNPMFGTPGAGVATSPEVKIGDTVTVFALDLAGRPFIEGCALIEAACAQPHLYRVRFLGEKTIRTRFVHPDWQDEPERCLTLLRQFWQAGASPPSFDEFFPDDPE
jgi:hypothetical protein